MQDENPYVHDDESAAEWASVIDDARADPRDGLDDLLSLVDRIRAEHGGSPDADDLAPEIGRRLDYAREVVRALERGDDVGTAAAPLDPALAGDPARVKVVTDAAGRALYFSRAPIPFRRDPREPGDDLYRQHIGIYAYSRDALTRWVAAPPSAAELAERLEQLRALHLGLSIGVAALAEAALPGIDTGDDLRRAEAHWHAFQG